MKVFSRFKMYVFVIQSYSEGAMDERSELKNHHDISNNVNRTCTFRVAGTANSDLSSSCKFSVLRVKRRLRKLAIKMLISLSLFTV
jgi:hypothetical protein